MNRRKLGLMAVALILAVGVMEVLALRLGSLEFPVPSKSRHPAVADQPGGR
ncbi:hypothetical protein [Actinomadura citrea]|uniref:Uncharacterized protein n=1 Tax=Actinomadura citrea TaxID=46158 RepID=A0A7Y9GI39_9ACTN|nr:hypothetical protein [Actinomadura citrea]NYE16892.1 hypothetical protein [Actinomadura citrea]GGT58702.1 hypothetical protein GCM10010177_13980 [Actinomadura citrea]